MAKSKPVADVKGEDKTKKADPNMLEYIPTKQGNYDIIILRMINSINSNLASIVGLLKIIANEKPKEEKDARPE